MKLAIMQPYIFPYIGYFQLINCVDKFVIYDDVQWIKGGWINRNRILLNNNPTFITFPVQKSSITTLINERCFSHKIQQDKQTVLNQIGMAYNKAPFYDDVIALIHDCINYQQQNVSLFAINSLRLCCQYLDIKTPFIISSQLEKKDDLHGVDRVLNIIAVLHATHYINPIGGTELYDKNHFLKEGVLLNFLQTRNIIYDQKHNSNFIPNLSIIDVMMYNSKEKIADLLTEFDLQ